MRETRRKSVRLFAKEDGRDMKKFCTGSLVHIFGSYRHILGEGESEV